MPGIPEFRQRSGANSLSWRVQDHQARVLLLQFNKLLKKSIEFRVGNDRIIEYKVTMLMEYDVVP